LREIIAFSVQRIIGTRVVKESMRLGSVNRWTGPPHWAR